MNDLRPSFDHQEFYTLLCQLRDEQLDVAGVARLESLVQQDSDARRCYVQMTTLYSHLHWYAAAEGLDHEVLAAIAVQRSQQPVRMPNVAQSSRTARMLAAIGVAGAFYGLFAIMALGLRPDEPHHPAPSAVAAVSPVAKTGVASVETTVNARWSQLEKHGSPSNPPVRGDRLAIGSQWALSEGSVAILFDTGARVNIDAPAEFTITAANAARFERGSLAASVPPPAVGFTVTTPTSTIVDLGTEFGVSIDRAGVTHVQVFVGKVRLEPAAQQLASGDARSAAIVLEAGQVRRLTPNAAGNRLEIDDATAEFIGTLRPPANFPRQIGENRRAGLRRVEHGGTFGPNNLARLPEARAFAFDRFDGRAIGPEYPEHHIRNLNDGRYGNQFSWLGMSGKPPIAGIAFGSKQTIASIAFGRDNGGEELTPGKQDYDDFWEGVYTLQFTTADKPDENTPDSEWTTLGTVEYRRDDALVTSGFLKPMIRHRYAFPPVEATGIRILVPGHIKSATPTIIDEIEVYPVENHDQQ